MFRKIPTWTHFTALFIMLFIALGLPVTDWGGYALLAVACIASCVGYIRKDARRWIIALAACLVSLVVRWLLPVHMIEEGHALFNPATDIKNPLAQALPPEVFDRGVQLMRRHQPNWMMIEPDKRLWAFAADSLWYQSSLSRQRRDLDFDDRWDLRVGTLNDERANLYNEQTGAYGLHIPLIFRFDFPLETLQVGPPGNQGRLCWRGLVFWPDESSYDDRLTPIIHQDITCRDFSVAMAHREQDRKVITLYALDIQGAPPLAMQIDTLWWRDYGARMAQAIGWLAGTIVLLALVRVRAGALIAGLIASILLVNYLIKDQEKWSRPSGLSTMAYMERGNDGLTHFGKGRQILAYLTERDLYNALRGEADIFYFMPGMRYVHAMMMIIFGDSLLGYFLVILLIPFLLYKIMCRILPRLWAIVFFWIYMITPAFEAFGFTHFYYVKLAARGFGGALAWVALYAAMAILLPPMGQTMRPSPMRWLGAGLLLTMATACRPNILPLSTSLALGFACLSISMMTHFRYWRAAGSLLLGFSMLGLITAHNWIYGHDFVLLTSSANNPANLHNPPSAWLAALAALFQGLPEAAGYWANIGQHVSIWIEPFEIWFIISYVSLWTAAFMASRPAPIRVLAVGLILAHMVFLFYQGYPRYNYGLWALTLMVSFYECRFHFLPWLQHRRCPGMLKDVNIVWTRLVHDRFKQGLRVIAPA